MCFKKKHTLERERERMQQLPGSEQMGRVVQPSAEGGKNLHTTKKAQALAASSKSD